MPRACSNSIQSDLAWRWLERACTAPARWTAPAYNNSFSVNVVFPASGWEMMANVRRRSTSRRNSSAVDFSTGRDIGLLFVVRGSQRDRGSGHRLASLDGNSFFYQSEWGGGKEGGGWASSLMVPMLAQRAVADSPRWTRAVWGPPRLPALGGG